MGELNVLASLVLAAEAGYSTPMFTPYVTPYYGMTAEPRILLVNGKKMAFWTKSSEFREM